MIRIKVFNAHPRCRVRIKETLSLVRHVLKNEGVRDAELNIVAINDRRMTTINGKYLHHRYATDVLSFPLSEKKTKTLEGEVYINLDQARRQASEYNVAVRNEIARLVTHGVLHLVGYRDATNGERKRMTKRENHYLSHNI